MGTQKILKTVEDEAGGDSGFCKKVSRTFNNMQKTLLVPQVRMQQWSFFGTRQQLPGAQRV